MDGGVCTNARIVHLGDQVRFRQMLGRCSITLLHLQLGWLECLALYEHGQLIVSQFFPVENLKPILDFHNGAFCIEKLTSHGYLDCGLSQLSIL